MGHKETDDVWPLLAPKNFRAVVPPLLNCGAMFDHENSFLPACYHIKFGHSRSNHMGISRAGKT